MLEKISIKETNLFFLIFMLGYISLALLVGMFVPADCPVWLNMCINDVVILLPIVGIMIYKKMGIKKVCKFSKVGVRDFLVAYIAAYTLMPMIYFLNYVTMLFAKNHVNDMVLDIYEYPFVIQLILIAVLPALVEEFIFRGFFYGSYRRKSILGGALMSGLFFGIAHMNINQFAYACAIGIAFCLLYEATENILIPATAHFAINANTIIMMHFMKDEATLAAQGNQAEMLAESPVEITIIIIVTLLVLSGVCLTIFSFLLEKLGEWHGKKVSIFKKTTEAATDKFIDVYFLVAVIPLITYMILLEM